MRLNPEEISLALEAKAQNDVARRRGKHLKPFRGLRGTPVAETTRILSKAWSASMDLDLDSDALHELFCTAHEDGIVAIGLLAACAPDNPMAALELVDRWLPMVDDTETADSLGWMVLGPALLVAGEPWVKSLSAMRAESWGARRAAVMAGLAMMPIPLQGACAAALRRRMGISALQFVEGVDSQAMRGLLDAYLRDDDHRVRKAFIRVYRSWAELDPQACQTWLDEIRGGVPKRLREELERGVRKGLRKQKRALEAAQAEE